MQLIAKLLKAIVGDFVEAGVAPATRRACAADLDHFATWDAATPPSEAQLAIYLTAHAAALSVATLVRPMASIFVVHDAKGYPNAANTTLLRATMRGIRSDLGLPQRRARPLLKEVLIAILDAVGGVREKCN